MPRPPKFGAGFFHQPLRPEVLAFLRDIKANPEDNTPRLILADWLEERGDPRGEYVRLDCALAHMELGEPAWQATQRSILELRELHAKEWFGPLEQWVHYPPSRRGLVRIEVPAWQFLKAPKGLAETEVYAWVGELVLVGMTPRRLGKLAASPNLEDLATLTLEQHELGAGEIVTLLDSPRLARLTGLELSGKPLRDRGAMVLAAAPQLARLHNLTLDSNLIGDEGAAALAASPHLVGLVTFDLGGNRIGDKGAEALAASPYFPHLAWLDLRNNQNDPVAGIGNRLSDTGVAALRRRFGECVRF
jgi:uncharacterized protein (TIGR02996 family)